MFQFRRFPTYSYVFSVCYMGMTPCRFPHSEIRGLMAICASPRLIAAYHVLHRLPVPRHSPCALSNLTFELSEFLLRVKSFASQKLYLPLSLLNFTRFSLACHSIFKVLCRYRSHKWGSAPLVFTPRRSSRCSKGVSTPTKSIRLRVNRY